MRLKNAGSPLTSTLLASRPTRPRPPRLAVLWLIGTEYRSGIRADAYKHQSGRFAGIGLVTAGRPLQLFETLDVKDKDDRPAYLDLDRVGHEHLARLDHRREWVEELGAALAAVTQDLHHRVDLLLGAPTQQGRVAFLQEAAARVEAGRGDALVCQCFDAGPGVVPVHDRHHHFHETFLIPLADARSRVTRRASPATVSGSWAASMT